MRYALYFAAPANDPLMQLGNLWLGRDPFTGKALSQPSLDTLSRDRFQALTTDPRRYGFHGTLKAPFALRDGTTADELVAACAAFASESVPFALQGLSVNRLGKFLALTPDAPEPDLSAFAATCVRRFEPFRRPLSESDLERRRKSGLTPDQDRNLVEWGYPYIFEDFRFHMTLSNKLEDEGEATTLEAVARAHFQDLTGRPRQVESLGLYCEAERGAPFMVHTIFPLTGTQTPDQSLSKCRGSK
ncbi:DUF1045 domain-containing protein [uncultured Roseibium sp.]|uniref:DUF1045 domain-containing protein n=1 Tax=uncultured Roseibium sp. TaxID=1936171 RepID=UPI0025939F16|nr:DUF1045 domain-containing protein [uncultured Roseibium sp.]